MNIYKPMSGIVWLWLLATISACLIFSYMLKKIDLFGRHSPFLLIGLMFGQVSEGHKKSSYGLRIFFLLFAFACFIFMVGYKGSLFSCLAIPIIPAPIGNIVKTENDSVFIYNYYMQILFNN